MPDTTAAVPPKADVKGVAPYLTVDGAMKAADFYRRAFGAELAAAQPVDDKGRTMHVHLRINGGSLMLSDAYPEHGHGLEPLSGFSLALEVDDIYAWWKRATQAGAAEATPVSRMFWGDLFGQVRDPFGVLWSLNQPQP